MEGNSNFSFWKKIEINRNKVEGNFYLSQLSQVVFQTREVKGHPHIFYEYKHIITIFLSELSGMIRVFVDKNDEQKQNCSSDTVQPIPTK